MLHLRKPQSYYSPLWELQSKVLEHQKGNRELHISQQSVQVHRSVTKLLLLRIPVCWDVTMQCWGITLLWEPHHSHYVFMFEAAVLVCCSEATDIHNVITWNSGANIPDCILFLYPHLYLPLHHHSPLQPLTTSTMLCHWLLSCALSFKLLIPRTCRCCSVTSNLLTEGLCLFLVHSGFVKVSFHQGF